MRKLFSTLFLLGAFVGNANSATINGAGASFPYPIYAKWAQMYQEATGNKLNYQSIGSGGGVKQIKAKTVDFGASDAPLKPEQLKEAGLMQFPAIIGGVVPAYNLPGVSDLKLSNEILADIFLGKIRKWNNEAIQALNSGANLPDKTIAVVHRSDGSGTTFLFTDYLSKVSGEWKSNVGVGKAVRWPTGIGGKGNEGVASYVSKLKGSIGYVEYAYAKKNNLPVAQLKNVDGNFVSPSEANFAAAAAGADWSKAPGMYLILTNQPGANSWPITGASFILMHTTQDKPANAKEVLKFFDWSFQKGKSAASSLDYVALPDSVTNMIRNIWKQQIKNSAGKSVM